MSVQNAALNAAVAGVTAIVTHHSLHTADGGSTGANEITGGAYSRWVPSYVAGAAGIQDIDTPEEFGGPAASSTVTHLGYWNGTTWLGSVALAASKTIGPGDTLTVTSAPIQVTAA
jgi:hypothetical protein